jgi:tellurite resistance protein TehA-like permease
VGAAAEEDAAAAIGSAQMATGIVSVGLQLDGGAVASRVLLAVSAALWLATAAIVARRAVHARAWRRARTRPGSLTAVAGTAVLASRLAPTAASVAWALAGLAACLLVALLPCVLAAMPRRVAGIWFLVAVAPQALAVSLALLAVVDHVAWPADLAGVLVVATVALYGLVLVRFDMRELARGGGDQWVLGGAAAITALAAGGVRRAGVVPDAAAVIAWGAWGWAVVCLVALVATEVLWPRPRYDVRRWATAFPVGMYAAAGFALAAIAHAGVLTAFAQVWVWVGVVVWLAVASGALRRALRGRGRRRACA